MKLTALISVCLLVSLFSCKYEDGPSFSLRSKKARVVNAWFIDRVYENGVDKTEDYKTAFVNYQFQIKKDDNFILTYRPYNVGNYEQKGTWKFSDDKANFVFTPEGTSDQNTWKIMRLKHNEFWVTANLNNKDVELHLKD